MGPPRFESRALRGFFCFGKAFVAIGFQHVVANMFVIPAAIFAGALSWAQFGDNFVPVFLGNAVGGAVFVGLAYHVAYFKTATGSEASATASSSRTQK
ncbi:formate/nitrite transporter family protein [Pseudomonas sp. CFBP 13602]|uniref:formate/nitrite transporter family protein n=1 Tax=Pseudomonas sp. CFBP 13602 TaxID=2774039 RepID=UPI003140A1A3